MKSAGEFLREWSLVLIVVLFALAMAFVISRFDTEWTQLQREPAELVFPSNPMSPRPFIPPVAPALVVPYPAPNNAPIIPTPGP